MFVYLFICLLYFVRGRQSSSGGGAEQEREPQNPKQAPGWAISTEANVGLEPMNCEIMTWAKVGRSTDWAAQAPLLFLKVEAEVIDLTPFIGHRHFRP